jgi:hypothetical protein
MNDEMFTSGIYLRIRQAIFLSTAEGKEDARQR